MKILVGSVFFIDLAFLLGCLFLPRSGMEALGAFFLLLPLAGLHLLAGAAGALIDLRRRRFSFPLYFAAATALMVYGYHLHQTLKPTYRPLDRVLAGHLRTRAGEWKADGQRAVLGGRRFLARLRDADHADLCTALDDPVDAAAVRKALRTGTDPNAPCAVLHGRTAPPLIALLSENPPCRRKSEDRERDLERIRAAAALLLEGGADPDRQDDAGDTALHWALRHREERLVSLLLARGACVHVKNAEGHTASTSARYYKLGKTIRAAAEDPRMAANCRNLLRNAAGGGEKTADGPLGLKDLLGAARAGNIDRAAEALEAGVDPDGADPSAADAQGITAMHWVARWEGARMTPFIDRLLAAGGALEATDRLGRTPLMMTAHVSHTADCLDSLLARGADPGHADRRGNTLLHQAAMNTHTGGAERLRLVLTVTDKLDRPNGADRSALALARRYGNHGAAQVLLAEGADPEKSAPASGPQSPGPVLSVPRTN